MITKTIWLLDFDGVVNVLGKPRPYLYTDWINFQIRVKFNNYSITTALGIVDFIDEIDSIDGVRVLWCSTWQKEIEQINKKLGLKLGWIDASKIHEEAKLLDFPKWKFGAAKALVNAGFKVIWTDDDLCRSHTVSKWEAPNLLKICPEEDFGLLPSDLTAIKAFINDKSVPST